MPMVTRRSFIKQSALAGAGLLLGQRLIARQAAHRPLRVVCIGAGFAGLAAAYKLKRKGYHVTVLESRDRVGGRIFSHPIADNLVVELGGEWIGHSHTRMQALCDEFGLPLQNNQFDTHLIYKREYFPAGTWDYSQAWKDRFNGLLENYRQLGDEGKEALDRYDWWRYLVNNGCDGRDLDIRELLDSTDFGESIRHVSAFAALAEYAESSERNEMDLKINGGNTLLATKLADAIGRENILLQHTVTKIAQHDAATVTCSNGKTFDADKIVCAIPTFALGRIDWQPGLPTTKRQAVDELQYARINKHVMLFRERFWKDESFDLITDETPHYFYHATKSQPGSAGALISYSIGDKAAVAANRNDEAHANDIIRTLSPHFGDIRPLILQQVNYYWGNDALSRGAYALYGPGQWFRTRPALAEPFLHTHFAGEHIADWQGFMEGAVQTGEEAADQLG